MQRFLIGAAALPSLVLADLYCSGTDERTSKIAAIKDGSKVIACTSVGIAVREFAKHTVKKNSQYELIENGEMVTGAKPAKKKSFFMPILEKIEDCKKSIFKEHHAKFVTSTALVFASAIMLFTNVFADVPLTVWLTNKGLSLFGFSKKEGDK